MQAARIVARRGGAVARARSAAVTRGGGGGAPPPSFMRLPAPKEQLHEHNDLVWDDGVAPEPTIDFDAPNVDRFTGFLMWLGGIAFLAGTFTFVKVVKQPETQAPFPKRDLPDLTADFGGRTEMATYK
ncbi:NADH dehydrogenase ubiquinone 1 beta subcomplex subunit 8, mitochondrial [Hondaea fermentalgiana]|uniref:NADH dehydrogenase ubiquinone 1 beta subcomplex subunit 8, mitochondrial n=1 Tax=Hondaea fermentalgiana TaxID=2315210 RepID=A0A2R5GRJ9_9STRA|nr:NADH dehydrogenase ubiquinone 1 beta subcomplex subunit 8, mitochondrial [Hondaea fermentalgiana]|eukprot:GBG33502.1 NADH dehydrogenase ubiquinone 1 beta subcomplex subunit 8, mitochondrial [Hondaea fermentalgiana]